MLAERPRNAPQQHSHARPPASAARHSHAELGGLCQGVRDGQLYEVVVPQPVVDCAFKGCSGQGKLRSGERAETQQGASSRV